MSQTSLIAGGLPRILVLFGGLLAGPAHALIERTLALTLETFGPVLAP